VAVHVDSPSVLRRQDEADDAWQIEACGRQPVSCAMRDQDEPALPSADLNPPARRNG
jgi:hypothetical protein